ANAPRGFATAAANSATIVESSSSRSERSESARKPVSSTSIIPPKNNASGTETETSSRRLSECTVCYAARRRPPLGGGVARQREPITPAAQRLDGTQLVLRVELAAQAPDQHLDDVAVALEVLVIQALGQFRLGDHIPGAQHQVLENAVLERGELNGCAAHCHGLRARIQHHRSAIELRARPAARPAQQRLQPRQHLLEVKGLGDVVIRARLQSLDLVLPVVARREDQDRVGLARRPQPADHFQAGKVRQPEVDDGDVQRVLEPREQPLVAVARHVHGKTCGGGALLPRVPQRRSVLDHQYAHAPPSVRGYCTDPSAASTRTVQTLPESLRSLNT